MRNYRIIAKQNNMGAWGSGMSQSSIGSPINDSIKFIPPLKLVLSDNIGNFITDIVKVDKVPIDREFKITDNIDTTIQVYSGGITNA